MEKITRNKRNFPIQAYEGLKDCQDLFHKYLMIAQGGIYTAPTLVQTVLGSCVSVTMYCSKRRWGGIFHALLPSAGNFPNNKSHSDPYRFVDSAIWTLLRDFSKSGISASSLECKVFGGASPLNHNCNSSAGNRNVQVAMEVLAEAGATVAASSVGGTGGRKIFFRTDTGMVLQKRFSVTSCRDCKE